MTAQPPIGDEDHEASLQRLRIGFALFVGGSMALIVLWGDGGVVAGALALLVGSIAGGVLGWWLVPTSAGRSYRTR